MKNIFANFCGIILLFMFFSCKQATLDKKKEVSKGVIVVDGYIVKPTLLDLTISVSGSLLPYEETVLMTEVSGRVVSVNLPEGKAVKKGTLLVKLFDGDLQAQLNKSQAQLKIYEQTEKRQSELLKISGISQSDYDQTTLQINSIKADIEILKVQIRKTELLAPYDGIIGLKNISTGAQITSATPIATIRKVDQLKLDFGVPEKYSQKIKAGLTIKFTVQGDDKKHEATVMATEENIESNTRNLRVRAIVTNPNTLLPGGFANVELRLGENKNALMVPTNAIIPQARNKTIICMRNGKAKFVGVKIGVRQEAIIEITEGLNIGDTIVTTGLLFIKPDQKVKFSKFK